MPVKSYFLGEPWRPEIRIEVYTNSMEDPADAVRLALNSVRADFDYNTFLEKLWLA